MSSNWFDRWYRRNSSTKRARRPVRRRARLELRQLEDRLAPATWTGATDSDWSTAGNWSNGQPTDTNAQLIFPANLISDNFVSNNDLPNLSISSIRIEGNDSYTISGNAITLGTGGLTVLNSTVTHTVSLPLTLGGLGAGFGISTGATVRLEGVVSSGGGATLNKNDQGTLVLTTANPNLLGSINVNAGTLQVTDAQALGPDNSGETTVSNDATATLRLSAGSDNGTENVHLGGRILVDSNVDWDGFVDLLNGSPKTIEVTNGNTFTLTGGSTGIGLDGSGSLLKSGAGTLVLAADSDFSGADVAAGVLNVQADSSTGSTTVETGAALEVQGNTTLTTSGLTLNGTGTGGNGALRNVANNNTVNGAVTLASNSTIGSTAGTLTVPGNINNAGFLLTAAGAGNLTFSGAISGTGGLTKTGAGTLVLSGSGANTYGGTTTVSQGALNIRKASALGGTGTGTTVAAGAALQIQGGVTIDPEPLTINGTGIGGAGALVNVSGGNTWSGNVTLGAASTIGSSGGTLTVNGNINNGGFLLTVTGAGSTVFGGAGVLSGTGGLTKTGDGTLTLSGTGVNTYTGTTTVSDGALNIRKASALGAITAGTSVSAGATLQLQGGVTFDAEPLTINGNGFSATGALVNVTGNNSWQGNIAVNSASRMLSSAGALTVSGNINAANRLTVRAAGGDVTVSGVVNGASGLDKDGAGTLTLAGTAANTFAGATRISAGTLAFNKPAGVNAIGGNLDVGLVIPATVRLLADNQIPNAATVTILPGGILDLNGHNETIGPLDMIGGRITTGTGLLTLNGAVTADSGTDASQAAIPATIEGNLSLGGTTRTFTVDDGPALVDLNVTAVVSAVAGAGLTKTGPGKMVLTGANTYRGSTSVGGGILDIDGTQADSATFANKGGNLAGNGTVGPLVVNDGGTLAPRAGESLTVQGTVNFASTFAHFTAQPFLNSIGSVGATAAVFLNNATLHVSDVAAFLPDLGRALTIIGSPNVIGTFDGLANGAIVVGSSGASYRVNYTTNTVTLTRVSGPAFQNRSITPTIDEGGEATLTGHITTILPTDIFFLEVNWGDGGRTETFKFKPGDPRDVVLHHRYRDDGVYSVGLLWRDQRGGFNTDTLSVTVNNVAPIVDAGGDEFFHGGMLTRMVTFTDPGQDEWTATVDFGDGSGPQVIRLHGGNRFLLRHPYAHPGNYTVTITVTDGDGGTGTSSFLAEV